MKFSTPLVRGRLIQRYKRFLADVRLDDGTEVTATCPNTGSMLGLATPGLAVWLSESDSPTRKYRHTWELVETGEGKKPQFAGVNTGHPNKLVEEAIRAGRIGELQGYAGLKREQKYGVNSRIDLLLDDPAKGLAYVEIKNVHLSRKAGLAEFPDAVTERGAKHLAELSAMVKQGHRAVMLYLVQRTDAKRLSLAGDIDPTYARAFANAKAAGVEAFAYACSISPKEIEVTRALPLEL